MPDSETYHDLHHVTPAEVDANRARMQHDMETSELRRQVKLMGHEATMMRDELEASAVKLDRASALLISCGLQAVK